VLGALLENNVRRALLIFDGDPTGFLTRPISGTILALFLVAALFPVVQAVRHRRRAPVPDETTQREDVLR